MRACRHETGSEPICPFLMPRVFDRQGGLRSTFAFVLKSDSRACALSSLFEPTLELLRTRKEIFFPTVVSSSLLVFALVKPGRRKSVNRETHQPLGFAQVPPCFGKALF